MDFSIIVPCHNLENEIKNLLLSFHMLNQIQHSLNFYKNLVQESLLNSKDLVEKATDVKEKLNCGQKVNKNIPQEIPDLSKQIKKEINNQKTVQTKKKKVLEKKPNLVQKYKYLIKELLHHFFHFFHIKFYIMNN